MSFINLSILKTNSYEQKWAKVYLETLPHKGWITVQNPHHFVEELIKISSFSKILEE